MMTSMADKIQECLGPLEETGGFLGGCIVEIESGTCLGGVYHQQQNLESAAIYNAKLIKSRREKQGGLKEILLAFGDQYHLICPVKDHPSLFFFTMFDRSRVNLAFARIALHKVAKSFRL